MIKDSELFDPVQDDNPIVSDGPFITNVMVVARDLGAEEVKHKKPLIGPAGAIFRRVFENRVPDIDPYLTNTVPYKPTNNIEFPKMYRDIFKKGLAEQIKFIKPKVIVTLGTQALETITGDKINGLKRYIKNFILEGIFDIDNVLDTGIKIKLVPLVHPSYIIRKGINNQNLYRYLQEIDKNEDFQLYFMYPLLYVTKFT